MSRTPTRRSPVRSSWPIATVFVAWTALLGFFTYSSAGAAPSIEHLGPAQAAPVRVDGSALGVATQLSEAFASVAARTSQSVVTIKVEAKQRVPQGFGFPFFPFPGGPREAPGIVKGAGSGVIFRADGAILTNNHVVERASRIDVLLKDGRSFKAKVVGTDPAVDLAVLKIEAKGLPAASFADSNKARVGQWVLAIGAPFGLDYSVTAGVLSAKGRGIGANEIEDYLQTDASINPGNSGGPLVDLDGRVLGINTMIVGRGAGIGFAIPSAIAERVGNELLSHGVVKRAWLGVSFQELSPELAESLGKKDTRGALVSSVMPDGPAKAAGLRPGDIIEKVDGNVVTGGKDLLRLVLQKPVGAKVTLAVRRGGSVLSVEVKAGERPRDLREGGPGPQGDDDGGALGLGLQPLDPQLADELGYRGEGKLVVTEVRPGSPADNAGLERGDVLVEADHRALQKPSDLRAAMHDGKALLRVDRKAGSFFTVLRR